MMVSFVEEKKGDTAAVPESGYETYSISPADLALVASRFHHHVPHLPLRGYCHLSLGVTIPRAAAIFSNSCQAF